MQESLAFSPGYGGYGKLDQNERLIKNKANPSLAKKWEILTEYVTVGVAVLPVPNANVSGRCVGKGRGGGLKECL